MSKRRKRLKDDSPSFYPSLNGIGQLLSEMAVATLDLHGLTSAQAKRRVRDFITTQSVVAPEQVVHIITGKGTHSEGPAVLWALVRDMLDDEVAGRVVEYSGMLGGGGWVIRLRRSGGS